MIDLQNDKSFESISLKQLKLFESIGRLKSVRRASEECNLSQPAVTQALAKLEQLVGEPLIARHASGSYLNEAGAIFHRRVARFVSQFEEALRQFGAEGGEAGARAVAGRLLRSQVRALIATVESGSFPQAAAVLGLSAATLQRAVRDLELNLRKPLFYRTAAGLIASPDAITLGGRFKLCLKEIEWGIQELQEARGGGSAPLVIGAMPLGGNYLLASVLDDFLRREPQADTLIRNESAVEMIRSLRAGDVDFVVGLIPFKREEGLESLSLARTPFSVVARKGHPLVRAGAVTLADLADYAWLVGGPGSSRRACFDRLFAGHATVRAPIATSAVPVIREVLLTSDRLTLMTSYELQFEGPGLATLPFGPLEVSPIIGVTMRTGWLPTRRHALLIDMLRERQPMLAPVLPGRAA